MRTFYIAQRYSGMEEKAFQNALNYFTALHMLGIESIISPILHTHELGKRLIIDYNQLDLNLIKALKDGAIFLEEDSFWCHYSKLDSLYRDHLKNPNSQLWAQNWRSKGCMGEYELGKQLNLPIYPLFETIKHGLQVNNTI